jgi:hypothetical protein
VQGCSIASRRIERFTDLAAIETIVPNALLPHCSVKRNNGKAVTVSPWARREWLRQAPDHLPSPPAPTMAGATRA